MSGSLVLATMGKKLDRFLRYKIPQDGIVVQRTDRPLPNRTSGDYRVATKLGTVWVDD